MSVPRQGESEKKPIPRDAADHREAAQTKIIAACRELGADVDSALAWYSDPDDWPDFVARPMAWVRLVVADALEQGFVIPGDACPLVLDTDRKPKPGPLDGLPLLHEDHRFIAARTQGRSDRDRLLRGYRRAWLEAADAEPVEHKRGNVGRRAANLWLMEATDR
ncbi:hypothetical protein [Ectothiorhodospira magna]|uniref:hypothetical protein n=1 Tax=Ectothiorhodospira magna TaxID=867345 RepID=UPI0011784390|nr:hypothetical protein [Ectothiorhodospira magna]